MISYVTKPVELCSYINGLSRQFPIRAQSAKFSPQAINDCGLMKSDTMLKANIFADLWLNLKTAVSGWGSLQGMI
jgi:hypothetical protein